MPLKFWQAKNADSLALYFGEDPTRCPFEQGTFLFYTRFSMAILINQGGFVRIPSIHWTCSRLYSSEFYTIVSAGARGELQAGWAREEKSWGQGKRGKRGKVKHSKGALKLTYPHPGIAFSALPIVDSQMYIHNLASEQSEIFARQMTKKIADWTPPPAQQS